MIICFLKKSSNIIIRNYDSFGYITDNRNFGYKKKNDNGNVIGDKILSASGAVFFSALDTTPRTLDELANRINQFYNDVAIETIKNDANNFYLALEKDKFVVSGKTSKDCEKRDAKFILKKSNTKTIKSNLPQTVSYQEKSPQDFLEEYFHGIHSLLICT